MIPGLIGLITPQGVDGFDFLDPDFLNEYYHEVWLSWGNGLAGELGNIPLSWDTAAPPIISIGGKDVWNVSAHSASAVFPLVDVYGFHSFVQSNDAVFPGDDGIIGPTLGGATGLFAQNSSNRIARYGAYGSQVEFGQQPRDTQGGPYLPSTGLQFVRVCNNFMSRSLGTVRLMVERSSSNYWNGPFAMAGLLKKPMPSDLEGMSSWWLANETSERDHIGSGSQYASSTTVALQSTDSGRTLLNDYGHQVPGNVRSAARGSGFLGRIDVPANMADMGAFGGLYFLMPQRSQQSYADFDLTNWTNSDGVNLSVSSVTDGYLPGIDSYSLVASGDANLTDTFANYSGPRACRLMAKVTAGTIPVGAEVIFTNGGVDQGDPGDLTTIGDDWTIVDAHMSGISDGLKIVCPVGSSFTMEVALLRSSDGYQTPTPPQAVSRPIGSSSGTDSLYLDTMTPRWPAQGELLLVFHPYGGWGADQGAGFEQPFANARLFSASNNNLRMVNRTDPTLTLNGVDVLTATGEVIDHEWTYVWIDWDAGGSNEWGLQWQRSSRLTVTDATAITANMYPGNESATNQLCAAISSLMKEGAKTSDVDRTAIMDYLDGVLPTPAEWQQ